MRFGKQTVKYFIRKAGGRYIRGVPLLCMCCVFMAVMLLIYRIEIYELIHAGYPEFVSVSPAGYLMLCLGYDSAAFLVSMALLIPLIIFTAYPGRTGYIAALLFMIFYTVFLFSCVEFFRIYETTFQTGFMGKENAAGLRYMFRSMRAEFSAGFYARSVTLSVLAAAVTVILRHWRDNFTEQHNKTAHRIKYAPAALALLLLPVAVTCGRNTEGGLSRCCPDATERDAAVMHELVMNPVYNLAAAIPGALSFSRSGSSTHLFSSGPVFEGSLDTASLVSDTRYTRSHIIPRCGKYNIIFYFFESTPSKYLDMKINGRLVTPTWHRLMKHSFIAENHYANYPLSANAMLAVFSSIYAQCSKIPAIQEYPDLGISTLPEILKSHGYRTFLVHNGMLAYAGQDLFLRNRGFDRIREYRDLKKPPFTEWVGWGLDERVMIKPALEFIREGNGEPFFAAFFPVNPHHPYPIPHDKFRITEPVPEHADYKTRNWMNYINSLHYADAALGSLIKALDSERLLKNTLLFLFADHGEAFYQHKRNYNHPLYIYEENVHVPFLIYNRDIFPHPVRYRGITRHIDILPSLLDILNIECPHETEGVALFSPHREQLSLLHTTWKDEYMGVRDGQWKYICRIKDMSEELYDLESDPEEHNNLFRKSPAITERYRDFVLRARKYKINYYRNIQKHRGKEAEQVQ